MPLLTAPEALVHRIILIRTLLLRPIMPLCHFRVVCLHIVTMRIFLWSVVLMDLGLRTVTPSTACCLTTTAGIFLRIVTLSPALRRSSTCTFANVGWSWPWVLELGGRVRALVLRVLAFWISFASTVA